MNEEKAISTLNKRLSRLESQNSRWAVATCVLGSIILLLVSLGATAQPVADEDVVRTSKLELVDSNGAVRARLCFINGEEPALLLQNSDGEHGVMIAFDTKQGGFISMRDDNGTDRVSLGCGYGSANLVLMGQNGKPRAQLSAMADSPLFSSSDGERLMYGDPDYDPALAPDGMITDLIAMPGHPPIYPGASGLTILDGEGKFHIGIATADSGASYIFIEDEGGEVTFNAP